MTRPSSPTNARIAEPEDNESFPIQPILPAYEQVAEQLRNLMVSGQLKPGQHLPSEAQLGSLFGVGRTTVREALRLLASQGLVITYRGVKGGTFVVTPEHSTISRYLEMTLGLLAGSSPLGIEDLLEARIILEVPATRLATARYNDSQLAEIAATMSDQATSNEEMNQSRFHTAILKASGNQMLKVMTRPIFDVIRTRLVRGAAPTDFWSQVVDDHQQIFAAMKGRDEEGAAIAMREHLLHLSDVYRSIDSVLHPNLNVLRPRSTVQLVTNGEEDR